MGNKHLHIISTLLVVVFFACEDSDKSFDKTTIKTSEVNYEMGEAGETNNYNFTKETVLPSAFVSWVKNPEHGLVKTRKINDIQISLTYLPPAYMVCNDLKKDEISEEELAQLSAQYEDFEYYLLKIEALESGLELAKYQVANQQEYEGRIKYYSFNMQNDLMAKTTEGKEVPCELYHFERTYNITPYSSFLIGFAKEYMKGVKERTIILDEKIFNKGIVKFKWTNSEMNNIPQVELLRS